LLCARCTAELHPGAGDFFRVCIEAVADPSPPTVTDEEAPAEIRRRIDRLLAQMHDLSEREALDQVCRRLVIHLCGPCYHGWIDNPTGT